MKTATLNISLTPYYQSIIHRFRKAGRYESNSEVVRAALKRLEETEWDPNAYPSGSVRHLYTPACIREEREHNQVSTLRVDHDE